MMRLIITILVGFGSGGVIAGAVFAFIAIIGIVPRLAQKTSTQKHIILYEEFIIVGGIAGTLLTFFDDFSINIGWPLITGIGLLTGVFYGCLAVSLAETLDVIPIMVRRANIKRGLAIFMVCLALGKLAGSLLYFLVPGFYEP